MFDDKVICRSIVIKDGFPAECGAFRYPNAECPNKAQHLGVGQVCPRCGSADPTIHNVRPKGFNIEHGGVHERSDFICKDPWHSSTHAGREVMNKLVGHAYYEMYENTLRVDPGAQEIIAEIKSMEYPEVSGGGVPYPAGRPGATRPTIAGAERAETAMPVVPSVLGREGFRQVLLRDVQFAIAALRRLEASIALAGKVLEPAEDQRGKDFPNDLDGQQDGRVTLRDSDDDLLQDYVDDQMTPGGTRPVGMGEVGSDEMPGMWEASDVAGGSEVAEQAKKAPDGDL